MHTSRQHTVIWSVMEKGGGGRRGEREREEEGERGRE